MRQRLSCKILNRCWQIVLLGLPVLGAPLAIQAWRQFGPARASNSSGWRCGVQWLQLAVVHCGPQFVRLPGCPGLLGRLTTMLLGGRGCCEGALEEKVAYLDPPLGKASCCSIALPSGGRPPWERPSGFVPAHACQDLGWHWPMEEPCGRTVPGILQIFDQHGSSSGGPRG